MVDGKRKEAAEAGAKAKLEAAAAEATAKAEAAGRRAEIAEASAKSMEAAYDVAQVS